MKTRNCENTPEKLRIHNGILKQMTWLFSAHPRNVAHMTTLPAGCATLERKLLDLQPEIFKDTSLIINGYELDAGLYKECVTAANGYGNFHVHNGNVMELVGASGSEDVVWLDWCGAPDLQKMAFGVNIVSRKRPSLLYVTHSTRLGRSGLAGLRAHLGVNGAHVADCVQARTMDLFREAGLKATRIFNVGYKKTDPMNKYSNPMGTYGWLVGADAKNIPKIWDLEMAGKL